MGLVTFTKTGPTAVTFTAASRAYAPSKEHQGFAYAPESGKLWWDAQKGKIARQEGKEAVEYVNLIDLGYEWTEVHKDGMPNRGITEPLTMTARIEANKQDGTLRWIANGTTQKGDTVFAGNTIFTRVKE